MASAHTQPPAGGDPPRAAPPPAEAPRTGQSPGHAPGQVLISAPQPEDEDEEMRLGSPVARLPVELDVVVPVREFRVRNLLALAPGHLIETQWSSGEDLPLAAGHVRLAWSEFEVIETVLAVRITRLA